MWNFWSIIRKRKSRAIVLFNFPFGIVAGGVASGGGSVPDVGFVWFAGAFAFWTAVERWEPMEKPS